MHISKIYCIFVVEKETNNKLILKVMKRFLINFKEVSYGVVEVFAETEEEARERAESYDPCITLMTNTSELELRELVSEEDIDEKYNLC